MGFRENLAMIGNLKRIEEMKNQGIGSNTISGIFKDNGMNISPKEIDTLFSASSELGKKALPKKDVNTVIKAAKTLSNEGNIA